MDQFARIGVAFDNRVPPPAQIGLRWRLTVQPEWNMLGRRIRTVANIAFIGKDRPHIAIEPDLRMKLRESE